MKKILAFFTKKHLYLGIVRYVLGAVMIVYAITKILKTQFVVIPFAMWEVPLEKVSGKTLAWAFLGHSGWFEILLGFLELIPGLLLLFRRTTLAGAILLLPVTLNVYLINVALNLWDETKLLSLVLVILNIIVLLFEWRKIRDLIIIVVGKVKTRFNIWEMAINLILIAVVSFFAIKGLMDYRAQKNILTGDWINNHPFEWKMQSEQLNGRALKARDLKCYFGCYGDYSEMDGKELIRGISYTIDERKKALTFFNENTHPTRCTYTLTGDSILQLNKVVDSVKKITVVQVFKRRVVNQ